MQIALSYLSVCILASPSVCLSIHLYVFMYVCTYLRTHARTHIHTYKHSQSFRTDLRELNLFTTAPFKSSISIGYTNLDTWQIQSKLNSKSAFSLPLMPTCLGSQQKMYFWQNKKGHTFVSPSQQRDVPASYIVHSGDTRFNP